MISLPLLLTLMSLAAVALWLGWERLNPAFNSEGGSVRIWRNTLFGMLSIGVSMVIVTPVSALASTLGPSWRAEWPFALRLITDLMVLEFFIYWWHRANHEVPFLWRFHRVHHYDEFLDATSAWRFHPGEMILSVVVRSLVVISCDISLSAILLFDALVVAAAGFHHSNVKLGEAAEEKLRRFIVTPRHHRVHHIPERAFTDSNYGTLTTLFDRLFGSWKNEPATGVYGVEGATDDRLPALMLDPFKAR